MVAGLVAGCGNMLSGDACPDVGPDASSDPKSRNCGPDFLSARRQRSILFSGNDVPRLYTGEPERRPVTLDTDTQALAGNVPKLTAYDGSLRVEIPADPSVVSKDIASLRDAAGARFDPNQRIRIDLNRATIDFMLQQLLRGALGVSYIAPENLGGSVTFRTEEPIPKSQVLLVVRDILTRNGLAIKYVNGVYHIGRPELIATLDSPTTAGQINEIVTRIVRLPKGSAHEVAQFARQLYPETITLIPSNTPRTIIVRAPPSDIDQVEETLKLLSGEAISEDRVAVIPLTQSAPEKIAGQLTDLYRSRLPQGADLPTIIPLEKQQALLIATRDSTLMEGVRALVRALDNDTSDEPTLRIIPLQHLAAEEIAQRLSAIFTGGATATTETAPRTTTGRGDRGPSTLFPPGQLSVPGRQTQTTEQDTAMRPSSDVAPRFGLPGVLPSGGSIAARLAGSAAAAGGAGPPVRIVPDTRTNSVMVYSTYGMYKRIRDVLRSLDVPQSQVAIEATVAEVELNDRLERGVQFYLQGPLMAGRTSTSPNAADPGNPGGFLQVGANYGRYRVDAVLNALQAVSKVKVISSPYLTVLDGKTARLVIGDQIPYTVRSQTSQNTGNVTVTQEVEIKDTGIILEVTPKINSNNSVALKISQQVSTPAPSAQAGNTTPIIATRSVDSNVLVQSGRTILLGGLIQDRLEKSENALPVIREVPIIGDFFKQQDDRVRRVELIVMITPRVSRQSSQIEDITRLIRSQLHLR